MQARGFHGPVVREDDWCDLFAIIHKPASFLNRSELEIPFRSSAHLVITDHASRGPTRRRLQHDERPQHALCFGTSGSFGTLAQTDRFGSGNSATGDSSRIAELAAAATFDVYRSAVLRPTERSLEMRRLLGEAIVSWSRPSPYHLSDRDDKRPHAGHQAMGVRAAWSSLNAALRRRIGREAPLSSRPCPQAPSQVKAHAELDSAGREETLMNRLTRKVASRALNVLGMGHFKRDLAGLRSLLERSAEGTVRPSRCRIAVDPAQSVPRDGPRGTNLPSFADVEFRAFSQNGEDGILLLRLRTDRNGRAHVASRSARATASSATRPI